MSFAMHWIPSLAVGFVLLIAAVVLEALIRAERRRQGPHARSPDQTQGPPVS